MFIKFKVQSSPPPVPWAFGTPGGSGGGAAFYGS